MCIMPSITIREANIFCLDKVPSICTLSPLDTHVHAYTHTRTKMHLSKVRLTSVANDQFLCGLND